MFETNTWCLWGIIETHITSECMRRMACGAHTKMAVSETEINESELFIIAWPCWFIILRHLSKICCELLVTLLYVIFAVLTNFVICGSHKTFSKWGPETVWDIMETWLLKMLQSKCSSQCIFSWWGRHDSKPVISYLFITLQQEDNSFLFNLSSENKMMSNISLAYILTVTKWNFEGICLSIWCLQH